MSSQFSLSRSSLPVFSLPVFSLKALLLACMFVVSVSTPSASQDTLPVSENEFVAASFGFKISRPDKSWVFQNTETTPGVMMLKVSRADAGGAIEVTIIAEPSPSSDQAAMEQRNAAFQKTDDKDEFSRRNKITREICGQETPGFEMDWKIQEESYRVHQCYVVNQDLLYTLAIHSPVEQFDSLVDTLENIRDTFQFVPLSETAKTNLTLDQLAARCGSEVDWATSWKEASEKARNENKSVLVLVRSMRGFDIADVVSTVLLMNRDIIEFLNEHCVVFRYNKGQPAPFADYDKYGIGPGSFGSTILLVRPDGTVFGDTFTMEPLTFYDFLLTSLSKQLTDSEIPLQLTDPVEKADWLTRKGDFAGALRHIDGLATSQAHQMRASIFRRQRRVDTAVEELRLAETKSQDARFQAKLLLDRTVLQLTTGQIPPAAAREILEGIIEKNPAAPYLAEVLYQLGKCQFAESDSAAAEKTWLRLIQSCDTNNRWTWLAAAALTSTAFRMDIPPEFDWPEENVMEAFRSIPFETLPLEQIDQAEQEAIAYLLAHQQDDGSWISPAEALRAKTYLTSPFAVAVTSICAKALLNHRADPTVAERIDRAVDFLLRSHQHAKTDPPQVFYMDYSPWSNAYQLQFLAHLVSVAPEQREKVMPLVEDSLRGLAEKQKQGGGWSYYISHTLAHSDQPSNQSISFMTAAVTIALLETRRAGFEVPAALTDQALDCLERMRNPSTTFTYFLWHDDEGQGRDTGEEGSAGRGPLCSLALSMGGRGSQEEISNCLDLFLKYSHLYSRERGKSLMHAAPGGQGSHYLMFDYAWAAAAAATLPEDQKKRYRAALLKLVLHARSEQGSYLDNPLNGWHYGTGMALEAMAILR